MTAEEIEKEKSKYTRKIEIPIYEPKNVKPFVGQLYDNRKTTELKSRIEIADIPDELKEFLYSAAERHTKFNFSKIADFYAHSDLEVKKLFEESALVIIDYDDAIKNGFISYQKEVDYDLNEYIESLSEDELLKNLNDPKNKAVTRKIFQDIF